MKYPEYIDGIKQEQNSVKRFFIKLWYTDWFRIWFVLCGIWWQLPIEIFLCFKFHLSCETMKVISLGLYMGLFGLGLVFNDYSNLRKIGLDEYHRKLKK